MLGRFLRLALPRFYSTLGDDAYEVLVACKDRLHNLGLVEIHGADYTIF